jgi:hypothetical protein
MEGVDVFYILDDGQMCSLFYPICLVPSLDILLFRIRCIIPYESLESLHVLTGNDTPSRELWTYNNGFAENVKSKAPIAAELIHKRAYINRARCVGLILLLF